MEEGQGADDGLLAVLRADEPGNELAHVGLQVAVCEHRALGRSGGSARVLEQRDVAGFDLPILVAGGKTREEILEVVQLGVPVEPSALAVLSFRELHQPAGRERQVVLDPGGDHPPNRRRIAHLAHAGKEVVKHDGGLGAGVRPLLLHLPRNVEGVGVDHQRARAQGAEERNHVLDRVGQHERHALALGDAEPLQGAGEPGCQLVEASVGEPPRRQARLDGEHHGFALGEALGSSA